MLDDTDAAASTEHLLEGYKAAVQQLRAAVRDVDARLRGVAVSLKIGSGVVGREQRRTTIEPPSDED